MMASGTVEEATQKIADVSLGEAGGEEGAGEEELSSVVVLAVDKSKQAEQAFDWYTEYLHKPDHKIVLVHTPEVPTVEMTKHQKISEGEWQKMKAKEDAEREHMLNIYMSKLKKKNLTGSYKTIFGKPGESIVAAARDLKAEMVVMGTRGMGTIRRTILGSVSDYVIHHAHCPVVVCRH